MPSFNFTDVNKPITVKEKPLKDFPVKHPLRNKENELKLVTYINERLQFANEYRKPLVQRFQRIDQDLLGFVSEDLQDPETYEIRKRREHGKILTNINPQLALTQIGRGITYLLSVFSPDSGMFEAVATQGEQEVANQFTALMNEHAIKKAYFRQLSLFLWSSLKYNFGTIYVEWSRDYGNIITDEGGVAQIESGEIWAGNTLRSVDMYNFLWDPSVNPIDIPDKAEYDAEISVHTRFTISRMAENGELYNVARWINDTMAHTANTANGLYYVDPPQIRSANIDGDTLADGSPNWPNILAGPLQQNVTLGSGVELANVYIRLRPSDFGLAGAESDSMEIWRITMAHGKFIANAEKLTNAHNRLPHGIAMPNEDNLGLQSRSVAEILQPFQDFGAFLLNTHIAATRKNIWDLIVYDPSMIDLAEIGSDVAARVPLKPTSYGKDIDKALKHVVSTVDTKQALVDFEKILDLMEFFFPTSITKQVADLQRATQHQSAAVVQGGHRDMWKLAKLVDTQAFAPARLMMLSNILQFQEAITIPNPESGKIGPDGVKQEPVLKIDPSKFRNAGLEYVIGDGLKGLDKMTIIQHFKEILNTAIQSSSAMVELDIPGMLNYWSDLVGVKTDLTQFRRTPEEIQRLVAAQNGTSSETTGA